MNIGLGISITSARPAIESASFTVSLTGLTSGQAIIGDHASIGYTTDPVSATETVKWSASSDPGAAATFGTGASPTDFTSADGFSLYLHVTDGGETVTRSAPVRKAQATGGVDLDLSFVEDSAISSTDLTANWTTNGNTLTYAITGTALPAGLSVSSAGVMTGTPTTVTADATYTLRGTDEYGRTTDDTFTLEITAAASGTITIDSLTYTRGTAGVAPDLASTVSSTGTTTANYTLRGVLAATAQTEAQIDASGNKFEITAATLAGLDGTLNLSNSETAGVISAYVFDSSGTAIKSAVVTETGVTYDHLAPAFSSAEVGTVDATSLIVTFDKTLYGSTSAADWDVQVAGSPATESAAVISGSTVDITLGTAVTNGQAVTVAYTGTGLVGVDAEQVATFTAQSVTNNVPAAGNFPVMEASNTTNIETLSTSFTLNLPASIASGELLVLEIFSATSDTVSATGWTARQTGGLFHLLTKTATGSEGATVAMTGTASARRTAISRRISSAGGLQFAYDDSTGTAMPPFDTPSLSPSGGAAKYLWVSSAGGLRSDWEVTAPPSGFTGLIQQRNASSSSTSRCGIASYHQALEASTLDPGAATFTGTAVAEAGVTYAVEPV